MTTAKTPRIESLDVIRGFALLGVLLVNAPHFAAPLQSVINPGLPPLDVGGWSIWSWAIPAVAFESKSITLFSMLFGVSIFLVGGERTDKERGATLRRRLGWLAVFGLAHGVLLWSGDILLSYAIVGFVVMLARSWSPRRLLIVGTALCLLSTAVVVAIAIWLTMMPPATHVQFYTTSWSPPPAAMAKAISAYHQGITTAFAANFSDWVETQIQSLLMLTVRTAGLMMIGLALFKTGFLSGKSNPRTYRTFAVMGAIALIILAVHAAMIARNGFQMLDVLSERTLLNEPLAPLVSLSYASALILIMRAGVSTTALGAFAAVGRMAFTNYLIQSLVMSTIFWSGRGFGLYGELTREQVILIAIALFAAQVGFSVLWLQRYAMGPLEWIWRRLYHRETNSVPPSSPAKQEPSAIDSTNLTKTFGAHRAVDGIDLLVPKCSVYGFLGANGAGKTTTIRMLLGLLRPTAGSIRVFGTDVAADRITAARSIGALLEARATYDHLTGRENLDITRRLLRLDAKDIDRVLDLVDLEKAAHRKVGHYSLGMRQRLGLARAMLGTPKLLVLDEPMNGLDPDGIGDMRRTIRALPERSNVTVFVSSHLLSEVEQMATHIGLMRHGRLALQGAMSELLNLTTPDLLVRTSRPAAAMLTAAGYTVREDNDGITIPLAGTDAEAAKIARLLVGANIDILELTPRQGDLEALYMKMQDKAAA